MKKLALILVALGVICTPIIASNAAMAQDDQKPIAKEEKTKRGSNAKKGENRKSFKEMSPQERQARMDKFQSMSTDEKVSAMNKRFKQGKGRGAVAAMWETMSDAQKRQFVELSKDERKAKIKSYMDSRPESDKKKHKKSKGERGQGEENGKRSHKKRSAE